MMIIYIARLQSVSEFMVKQPASTAPTAGTSCGTSPTHGDALHHRRLLTLTNSFQAV